jgi:hypothetical protein
MEMGQREGILRGFACSRSVPVQRDGPTSDIWFSKIGFFSVHSNGYQLHCMSQKIEVVMAAAEKYLGVFEWWCPVLLGCWTEVGLDRFKQWSRLVGF